MEMKICKNPNCKYINPQPIDNFRLTSKGYRGKCKECEREYSKEYSRKNAKLRAEKQRKYYEEHGEIQKEASRKWKENNKEHISQYNKNGTTTIKNQESSITINMVRNIMTEFSKEAENHVLLHLENMSISQKKNSEKKPVNTVINAFIVVLN